MANFGGIGGPGARLRSRSHMVEEIVPNSGWTEDTNCHYLLVDLPDFKKEEVKLHVNSSGDITVSGERKVSEGKFAFFEQNFKLPENSDADQITGKFDGGLLSVTVPKRVEEQKREPEIVRENVDGSATDVKDLTGDGDEHGNVIARGSEEEKKGKEKGNHPMDFPEQTIKKWEKESMINLGSVVKLLKRNKGIVLTVVLAFSLGVLVSRKLDK